MEDLYKFVHPITKKHSPMISKETYDIITKNAEVKSHHSPLLRSLRSFSMQRLNSAIIYDRDFSYQYFGFKTLERSYLLKINKKGEQNLVWASMPRAYTM